MTNIIVVVLFCCEGGCLGSYHLPCVDEDRNEGIIRKMDTWVCPDCVAMASNTGGDSDPLDSAPSGTSPPNPMSHLFSHDAMDDEPLQAAIMLSLEDSNIDRPVEKQITGDNDVYPFTGLRNLGQTCYANTTIQVMILSMPVLKETLIQWDVNDLDFDLLSNHLSFQDMSEDAIGTIQGLEVMHVIHSLVPLQNILSSVAPSPALIRPYFVALGLDTNRQHDAHEFFKRVLLPLLEACGQKGKYDFLMSTTYTPEESAEPANPNEHSAEDTVPRTEDTVPRTVHNELSLTLGHDV